MIKLRVGEVQIEVESEAELSSVLRSLPQLQAVTPGVVQEDGSRNSRRYARLVRRLRGGRHWTVIDALAHNDKGLSDVDLRSMRGLNAKMALGGSMSGISKLAAASKLEVRDILQRERLLDVPGARYRYRLAPEFREFVLRHGAD
jgi:hypothetical protein